VKKCIAILLLLALLASLSGCGETEDSAFRVLEVLGEKQFCAICRGGDKLAPLIDAALKTVAGNGQLANITVRWLGRDRSCLEGDAAALNALEELPTPRRLIIGVETDYEPIAFEDSGTLRGMSVELAQAIGEVIGWEIMLLPITPDDVADQLNSGNIDCALGFDVGIVNAEKFSVGEPYLKSNIVLAVRSESEVRRVRDLNGSRIGVVHDPAVLSAVRSSEKLTKHASGATEYLSIGRCINALDNGWCAAVAMDSLMLSYFRGA